MWIGSAVLVGCLVAVALILAKNAVRFGDSDVLLTFCSFGLFLFFLSESLIDRQFTFQMGLGTLLSAVAFAVFLFLLLRAIAYGELCRTVPCTMAGILIGVWTILLENQSVSWYVLLLFLSCTGLLVVGAFLATRRPKLKGEKQKGGFYRLLAAVLLGSSLATLETTSLSVEMFFVTAFFLAFLLGLLLVIIRQKKKPFLREALNGRSISFLLLLLAVLLLTAWISRNGAVDTAWIGIVLSLFFVFSLLLSYVFYGEKIPFPAIIGCALETLGLILYTVITLLI
jgi:drug/metabolite transporter (DMT)-like permease